MGRSDAVKNRDRLAVDKILTAKGINHFNELQRAAADVRDAGKRVAGVGEGQRVAAGVDVEHAAAGEAAGVRP